MISHCCFSLQFTNSCIQLFAPLWTVACQALSMGFLRQEYWSGLPFSPPEDLPNVGIEPVFPVSPASQADSLSMEPSGKALIVHIVEHIFTCMVIFCVSSLVRYSDIYSCLNWIVYFIIIIIKNPAFWCISLVLAPYHKP